VIYLLHFDRPYHHARHYLGFVNGGKKALDKRVERHRAGNGAKLLRALIAAGIGFVVAKTWPEGDRSEERRLKKHKHAPRLCPLCCA